MECQLRHIHHRLACVAQVSSNQEGSPPAMVNSSHRSHLWLLVPICLALSIVGAAAWLTGHALAQTSGPQLAATDLTILSAQPKVNVSISFDPNGAAIAALQFSLDIDPNCLVLPQADSDSDGIPDAVAFTLPKGVIPYFMYDGADTVGEIGIALVDTEPPFALLTAEHLVTFAFAVGCQPAPGRVSMTTPLLFSTRPLPSFSSPDGKDVSGGFTSGLVTIVLLATATPDTPTSETPTPETPTPETPTPETPTPETPTPETPSPTPSKIWHYLPLVNG